MLSFNAFRSLQRKLQTAISEQNIFIYQPKNENRKMLRTNDNRICGNVNFKPISKYYKKKIN